MNILVLGGTVFLGRHIVNSALRNNHNVTLFNRGVTNPDLYPDVEKLKGDRNGNLDSLRKRKFDAVIDISGYLPSIVRNSVEFLKDKVEHYTYISSVSVYKSNLEKFKNENSELNIIDIESGEKINNESYGALKALCEKKVQEVYKENCLILRSGLIVGEDDPYDRFTYWVDRIKKGGTILLPDDKNGNLQFIDVKDISEWIVKMVEDLERGVYNVTGPDYKLTLENFIWKCITVIGDPNNINLEWANVYFLIGENKVLPYQDIPLWRLNGFNQLNHIDFKKALAKGLKIRPVEETIIDSNNFASRRKNHILKAGLSSVREKELLGKWIEKNIK